MSHPNEYSPNNNTSQNIDIYQRNKIYQTTQCSSYISREQSIYEPYSPNTPYPENFFSTPNQNIGYFLNNQNFNQNYINNLNNEKNILLNQNNINSKNEMNNNIKNDIKESKNNENQDNVQDPDEKLFEKRRR